MEMLNDSLKLNCVTKSFDQINEDASSILSLVQELRNLEKSLELANETLTKKEEELQKREQDLETRSMNVSERENELDSKLVSKRTEHQECVDDLTAKRKQLGSVMKSIEDQSKKIKEEETKLGYKEKELSKLQKLIGEVSSNLQSKEKDLQSKEKHLHSIKGSIRECSEKLEDKERKYKAMSSNIDKLAAEFTKKQKHLDSIRAELEAKTKQRDLVSSSISKCCASLADKQKELALEEKKLAAVESYTKELSEKLDVQEKKKRDCEDMESKLSSVQEFIKERSKELALKKKELESVEISIIERTKELEALKKQDIMSEKSVTESSEELQSKKKHLDLVEKSSVECSEEHVSRESLKELEQKLEANQKQLELKDKKINSMQELVDELSKKLEDKEKQLNDKLAEGTGSVADLPLQANRQAADSSAAAAVDDRVCLLVNERSCPLILEDGAVPDLMTHEVLLALQRSADPAKFVFDLMNGSYSQHLKNGGVELDADVVRSEIMVMEQLNRFKPAISPNLKEAALKLATLWKKNVLREPVNGTEASAFLLFLYNYKLRYFFNSDEILGVLVKVAHQRHAPDLFRSLSYEDKIPKLISILLERKQFIDAARFSCAFGLLHIFPLDTIQRNCVEHMRRSANDQARENELTFLKALLQCVMEYRKENVCDSLSMTRRIFELETERASSSVSRGESSLQGCNKRPRNV